MRTTPLTGYIDTIQDRRTGPAEYDKKVVKLKMPDKQVVFVEFRSDTVLKKLKNFFNGERVTIDVSHEGKESKTTGVPYNNIVAHDIKPSLK